MSGIDEVEWCGFTQARGLEGQNSLEGELDLCDFRIIGVTSNSEDLV
jgi:hypothetical protein